MDGGEFIVLIVSGFFALTFFIQWYSRLQDAWPPERGALAKRVFKLLPAAAGAVIFFTLTAMASFDVVMSFTFVVFYMPMGFAFIYFGLDFMRVFFGMYWDDDAIHNDNKAAVPAVSGAFIALAVIYSGANVGDGPGWWTVVFAGGLGLAAWLALWAVFGKITDVFERVTVERDAGCGMRLGGYFIASGIVLGRASAGDWTSAAMTVVEFADGWPALPLMALMAVLELTVYKRDKDGDGMGMERLKSSIICGAAFVIAAIAIILFVCRPLPQNPIYATEAAL